MPYRPVRPLIRSIGPIAMAMPSGSGTREPPGVASNGTTITSSSRPRAAANCRVWHAQLVPSRHSPKILIANDPPRVSVVEKHSSGTSAERLLKQGVPAARDIVPAQLRPRGESVRGDRHDAQEVAV